LTLPNPAVDKQALTPGALGDGGSNRAAKNRTELRQRTDVSGNHFQRPAKKVAPGGAARIQGSSISYPFDMSEIAFRVFAPRNGLPRF
jgi:hypothetical protein